LSTYAVYVSCALPDEENGAIFLALSLWLRYVLPLQCRHSARMVATVSPQDSQPSNQAPGRTMIMQAVKGLSMEKWLCWGSMGVAGLLALLFLLDMFIDFPFGGIPKAVSIVSLLTSALVLYLGWDAYRELR